MIYKKETLANLINLSFADLVAIEPYSGSYEQGYRRLISEAIEIKIQRVLVQGEPRDEDSLL